MGDTRDKRTREAVERFRAGGRDALSPEEEQKVRDWITDGYAEAKANGDEENAAQFQAVGLVFVFGGSDD
jgi:hypothetical protein